MTGPFQPSDPDSERCGVCLDRLLSQICVSQNGDAVCISEEGGRISYANPAFVRLTGYTDQQLNNLPISRLHDPEQDADALGEIEAARQRGEPWNGELGCVRRDGRRVETRYNVSWSGGLRVDSIQDLTEINLLELAADEAEAAKRDFTAMVSHELRTPICAVMEAVDLVADGLAGPLTERQKEFLTLARRNVQRLTEVVEKLVDYALLERSAVRMEFEELDLNEIVTEAAAEFRSGWKLGPPPDIRFEPAAAPLRAPLCRRAVTRTLTNLFDNAARYSERTEMTVRTRREGPFATVVVLDRGVGMPPSELERIFHPYVQSDSGPGRRVGGTGVGLAICRRLTTLHGGCIWASPTPGGGATFHVAFPIDDLKGEEHGDAHE